MSRLRSDVTDPDNPDRHSGHVGIKTKKAADKMIQPPSLFLCAERRLFRKDVVLETVSLKLDGVDARSIFYTVCNVDVAVVCSAGSQVAACSLTEFDCRAPVLGFLIHAE